MNHQAVESVVNRAMMLEKKVKELEMKNALLMDVVCEAEKFCRMTKDCGHHLTGLKNMLERAKVLIA